MAKEKLDYIYGIHSVLELIESGKDVEAVYLNRNVKSSRLTELRKLLRSKGIPSKDLPQKAFQRFGNKNHQGVVAVLSIVQFVNLEWLIPKLFEEGKMPLILILDHITDVRNFGAICRSASCFGIDAVVIPAKGSALINEFAIKSSAGAIFHLNIARVRSLEAAIDFLKTSGIRIIACSEKGNLPHFKVDLKGPVAIIMGSEEKGITLSHLKKSQEVVKIPMQGPVGSLNVSVASGILLSEVYNQNLNE